MVGKKPSIRASSAPVYPALYLHMWKSKNEEFVLQQLFKELLKNPKCYSSFSQMKSYCTLFSRFVYYFLPAYLSFFFFFFLPDFFFSLFHFFSFSSLCSPSVLRSLPLFSIARKKEIAWVCSAWAWVDGFGANLGVGLLGVGVGLV